MREWEQSQDVADKLFGDLSMTKLFVSVCAAAWGYFFPTAAVQGAALAAFAAVLLDTATGLVAAMVSGQAISSTRLSRVVVKVFCYASTIAVAAMVSHHVAPGFAGEGIGVSSVAAFIILTESVSVLENVRRMGVGLPDGLEKWLRDRETR